MKREQLSDILGNIDDRLIAEAYQYDPARGGHAPERTVHMKKKRIFTLALAAALILALGTAAYSVGTRTLEWYRLREDTALRKQAEQGAEDLHRFTGGHFVADDEVRYEDGDSGQTDSSMYFYNNHSFMVDYYGSGEIHALNAREAFTEEHPGYIVAADYWEAQYPDAQSYKAKVEAAAPGILDALHADGWIAGEGSGVARAYCNARCRFMDDCAVCRVLMADGTAYELWLQPETLEVEGFMYFIAKDTPNTRGGFFTALQEGTEEEWWDALQNSSDALG